MRLENPREALMMMTAVKDFLVRSYPANADAIALVRAQQLTDYLDAVDDQNDTAIRERAEKLVARHADAIE